MTEDICDKLGKWIESSPGVPPANLGMLNYLEVLQGELREAINEIQNLRSRLDFVKGENTRLHGLLAYGTDTDEYRRFGTEDEKLQHIKNTIPILKEC